MTFTEDRFGRANKAAYFNPYQYLTYSAEELPTNRINEMSISFWLKLKKPSSGSQFDLLKYGQGYAFTLKLMSLENQDSNPFFYIDKTSVDYYSFSKCGFAKSPFDRWVHIVMTNSVTNGIRFYFDGAFRFDNRKAFI